METGTRIAPAMEVFTLGIPLSVFDVQRFTWDGIDGMAYSAQLFESEETGPYLRVLQCAYGANAAEQVWHLPESTDILRLIANGAMAPNTRIKGVHNV